MEAEMQTKIHLVRQMLSQKGYDGVLINSQANLAWLTGGRHFVNVASTDGVGAIFLGRERVEMLVNNIEGERLWQEEGGAKACDALTVYPWYEEELRAAFLEVRKHGLRVTTDNELRAEFLKLRLSLTAEEQERLRLLGRLTAEAVETAARAAQPGQSEYELAALLAKASYERGLEPLVCLVGADERALTRRHPLPTDKRVAHYALFVLSARRYGLVVSASRAVHFGKVPEELAQRQTAVNRVLGRMLAASRMGASLGSVFKEGVAAYSEVGLPDEWQAHHQGGLAGYQSREVRATASTDLVLESGMVLAWNPTIQGAKAEDTYLLTSEQLDNLTITGTWPRQRVEVLGQTFEVPWVLQR